MEDGGAATERRSRVVGVEPDQALSQSDGHCVGPVIDPEFSVDVNEVALDGGRPDLKGLGDLAVGPTPGRKAEDLEFA